MAAVTVGQARELVALLVRLTESYGVDPGDIEPEALACALKVEPAEMGEALARVVRLAATNKQLRGVSLPPLLLGSTAHADDAHIARAVQLRCGLSVEERAALDAVGITAAEYEQGLRGTFGTVLGLRLSESAFKRALATCRTKRAQKHSGNEAGSLEPLRARLRAIAKLAGTKTGKRAAPADHGA